MENNYKKLKEIAYGVCDDICKKERIEANIYPVTFVDYYKSDVFKKNIKLKKYPIDNVLRPIYCNGSYFGAEKSIVVFLNNFKSHYEINSNNVKASFLFVLFHEIRHAMQQQKITTLDNNPRYDLGKVKIELDNCRTYNGRDYKSNHDWFFHEIDADKYGVDKAREYLIDNNSYIGKSKQYLELREFYYKYREIMYNMQLSIDRVYEQMKQDKRLVSIFFNECYLLHGYLNGDGTYKNLKEIMNNCIVNTFDQDIRYNIVASKSFLKQLDFSKLSSEEMNYVLESVNYVYNERLKKEEESKLLEKQFKNRNKNVEEKHDIHYLIHYFDMKLNLLVNKKNSNYYSYLKKILDEYEFHDKIVEGGKKL